LTLKGKRIIQLFEKKVEAVTGHIPHRDIEWMRRITKGRKITKGKKRGKRIRRIGIVYTKGRDEKSKAVKN